MLVSLLLYELLCQQHARQQVCGRAQAYIKEHVPLNPALPRVFVCFEIDRPLALWKGPANLGSPTPPWSVVNARAAAVRQSLLVQGIGIARCLGPPSVEGIYQLWYALK